MNQQGYVIEIVDDKIAKLKVQRHSACASCGKCSSAHKNKEILINADNTIGAKLGDYVEISMKNINILKVTSIVYLCPLIGLFIGTLFTYLILQSMHSSFNIDILSGISGFLCMGIIFLLIRYNEKRFKQSKEFIPNIIKIIKSTSF